MTIGLSATMEHQESQLNSSLKMVLNPQIILLVGSKKTDKAVFVTPSIVYAGHPRYAKI